MKTIKITENYPNGNIKSIRYAFEGTLDEKTFISYFSNVSGLLHKEDGPAYINYYKNGNIKNEYYYINGVSHRKDGPAEICYYENGNIQEIYYYINGKRYRDDGPVYIWYYNNKFNTIKKLEFYIKDKKIKGNHPYFIKYDKNGKVINAKYENPQVKPNKLFEQGSYFNYLNKIRSD